MELDCEVIVKVSMFIMDLDLDLTPEPSVTTFKISGIWERKKNWG